MATAKPHVYFNLHRACWSIMLRGKVTGHAPALTIANARFVVREGGRQRVLREGRKNVHAFVVGDTDGDIDFAHVGEYMKAEKSAVEVTYRPTSGATFVRKDNGAPVVAADLVYLSSTRRVYAINPR